MGYYCTVPQCTSLAGKTKNVKFHRFPRDGAMADKWNVILKRGKPYTKYSKVCSLHFTQGDYNVTNMGQWKTLSKDAIPSQNLPKLNPDGTVMVIRKSRTLKYKDGKKEEPLDKTEKWSAMNPLNHSSILNSSTSDTSISAAETESSLAYRLHTLHAIASSVAPNNHSSMPVKPKKQDAIMQTDPVQSEEDDNNQPNNSYSEASENSFHSELDTYPNVYQKDAEKYDKNFEPPKDYTKTTEDYIPQTNEEYNKEAEKYALGRKSHNGYEKPLEPTYSKPETYKTVPVENGFQKITDMYNTFNEKQAEFQRNNYPFSNSYSDSAEILRNQQHNLQILQEQHRITENQNFFNENHIKQEVDLNGEEDKFLYERTKDQLVDAGMYSDDQRRIAQQRILEHLPVKQEPEGCENVVQPQGSPYYANGHNNVQGYYDQLSRPGPELLIAKQNALAAHTQLWQNTMKRPFFYSETPHYNGPPLLHRYEDIPRILQ